MKYIVEYNKYNSLPLFYDDDDDKAMTAILMFKTPEGVMEYLEGKMGETKLCAAENVDDHITFYFELDNGDNPTEEYIVHKWPDFNKNFHQTYTLYHNQKDCGVYHSKAEVENAVGDELYISSKYPGVYWVKNNENYYVIYDWYYDFGN